MNLRTKSTLAKFGFLALLCVLVSPGIAASAQGGKSGGGNTGGGNTGGGNSGGGVVLLTSTIQMANSAAGYNGVIPQGVCTFTASKDFKTKLMDIDVSNVNVPDGTYVTVSILDATRVTGRCWHYESFYYSMKITAGSGSLSYSSAKGDVVPFLDPKRGFTTVSISPDTTTILSALLPFKGKL